MGGWRRRGAPFFQETRGETTGEPFPRRALCLPDKTITHVAWDDQRLLVLPIRDKKSSKLSIDVLLYTLGLSFGSSLVTTFFDLIVSVLSWGIYPIFFTS
jgi:hypothetical protein